MAVTADYIDNIIKLRLSGLTYDNIGAIYAVSHERIRQLLLRYRPDLACADVIKTKVICVNCEKKILYKDRAMLKAHKDGLCLDCGSGFRKAKYLKKNLKNDFEKYSIIKKHRDDGKTFSSIGEVIKCKDKRPDISLQMFVSRYEQRQNRLKSIIKKLPEKLKKMI